MSPTSAPDFGVIILTMGKRKKGLAQAIGSVMRQTDVSMDILVVGNGWDPKEAIGFPGVRTLALPYNVGIPAGRNAGVEHVSGELLFFLDDDAELADDHFLRDVRTRFEENPEYGALQGRVSDREGNPPPSRWVPRIGSRVPDEPLSVFSLWEGAVAVRRSAFIEAGGWPADFFYAHEGIELAWRVWEQRLKVIYDPDLHVYHPVKAPTRHQDYYRLSARNRVWVARRNLPGLLAVVYTVLWALLQLIRGPKEREAISAWFGGFREGWRHCPRSQPKMGWNTICYCAKNGRLLIL
ncbi:glycosyltransferase family 2 protein [Demequina sediminicola]|uniref:glycosyltransferase family 2 protein n=1 Tax=Demequina sediminicola TaxID=1095026 RepID=UPI000782F9AA|nr:glycosyltransferase [Demequina sediminicola]